MSGATTGGKPARCRYAARVASICKRVARAGQPQRAALAAFVASQARQDQA